MMRRWLRQNKEPMILILACIGIIYFYYRTDLYSGPGVGFGNERRLTHSQENYFHFKEDICKNVKLPIGLQPRKNEAYCYCLKERVRYGACLFKPNCQPKEKPLEYARQYCEDKYMHRLRFIKKQWLNEY